MRKRLAAIVMVPKMHIAEDQNNILITDGAVYSQLASFFDRLPASFIRKDQVDKIETRNYEQRNSLLTSCLSLTQKWTLHKPMLTPKSPLQKQKRSFQSYPKLKLIVELKSSPGTTQEISRVESGGLQPKLSFLTSTRKLKSLTLATKSPQVRLCRVFELDSNCFQHEGDTKDSHSHRIIKKLKLLAKKKHTCNQIKFNVKELAICCQKPRTSMHAFSSHLRATNPMLVSQPCDCIA